MNHRDATRYLSVSHTPEIWSARASRREALEQKSQE